MVFSMEVTDIETIKKDIIEQWSEPRLWDKIEQASLNYALSNYHVNPSSNVFSGNISFC